MYDCVYFTDRNISLNKYILRIKTYVLQYVFNISMKIRFIYMLVK